VILIVKGIFNFLQQNKLACQSFEQKYCPSGIAKESAAFSEQMLKLLKDDSVKFWKMLQ
jgi:hypothetical protein